MRKKIYLFQKAQSNIYIQPAPASRPPVSVSHPKVTSIKHSGGYSGSGLADKDAGSEGLYSHMHATDNPFHLDEISTNKYTLSWKYTSLCSVMQQS